MSITMANLCMCESSNYMNAMYLLSEAADMLTPILAQIALGAGAVVLVLGVLYVVIDAIRYSRIPSLDVALEHGEGRCWCVK